MFMPTIFKLVFQHTDLEGTSITDLEGIGSVRLGGLLTWRATALEGSLGAYISDLSFPATRRIYIHNDAYTVRHRGIGTGISEASKRVPIFCT